MATLALDLDLLEADNFVDLRAHPGLICPKSRQIWRIFQLQASASPSHALNCLHRLSQETPAT